MDGVHKRGGSLGRRCGQDPMAQIEDVAHLPRSFEYVGHAFFQLRARQKQRQRIEVSLNCYVVSQNPSRLVDVDSPVEPDHVRPGALHQR